jgi:hypothetical protein
MLTKAWRWLRPANRRWLGGTTAVTLLLSGLYAMAHVETTRLSGTGLGLAFGMLAFALMLMATAYSVRKRWRPLVAQRLPGGRGRSLRRRRQRDERLRRARVAIADLQAEINRDAQRDLTEVGRRAQQILRGVGAARGLRVEVEKEVSGVVRLWVDEKEPPGSLENWLLAHSYLGFLAMLLVMFHAGFRFGGLIAMLGVMLSWVVGLSGLLGAVLYVVIPGYLGHLRDPLLPPEMRVKIAALERSMAGLLQDKSGPFQEIFLYGRHELSAEDISKVEDEEKADFRHLFALQAQKHALEAYLAQHLRYETYLHGWLYIHVPAVVCLLTVVIIHILSILYY